VSFENKTSAKGEHYVWLEPSVVARLRVLRGPGKSYSDVILRVASSRDWILPDRSRRPRRLRTAEGRSLVGVMDDACSSLRGHQRRASASQA
jgi:hypothetical protein